MVPDARHAAYPGCGAPCGRRPKLAARLRRRCHRRRADEAIAGARRRLGADLRGRLQLRAWRMLVLLVARSAARAAHRRVLPLVPLQVLPLPALQMVIFQVENSILIVYRMFQALFKYFLYSS